MSQSGLAHQRSTTMAVRKSKTDSNSYKPNGQISRTEVTVRKNTRAREQGIARTKQITRERSMEIPIN